MTPAPSETALPEPTTPPAVAVATEIPPAAEPAETATAIASPLSELVPPVTPEVAPDVVENSPAETKPPAGAGAVLVEAMTSNDTVTPGEPNQYRFHLTNTAETALTVQPIAVNSLEGWTGAVLLADGTSRLSGPLTFAPGQGAVVVVEVNVPADARVGDQNQISLKVELAEAAEAHDHPRQGPAREPDSVAAADGRRRRSLRHGATTSRGGARV